MAEMLSTLKPMKAMKAMKAAVMKKPAATKKPKDYDIKVKMCIKNGNSGEVVEIEDCVVGSEMTPVDTLQTHLWDFYDWEDEAEMEVVMLTAVANTTFTVNGAVVDGKTRFRDLVKEGDQVVMKTKKFKILAGAVMDSMAEAVPEVKIEKEAKHGMPPPTGTFKKNNLK